MSPEPAPDGASWRSVAIASGACAAFNGVFAKLTTDDLTSSWAEYVAKSTGLSVSERSVEVIIRALVFVMYFVLSSTMWALFTHALSLSPSAVHVNIVNTAANFVITAILGALIFGESLPLLWWVGASLLITGSVIIGKREEVPEDKAKTE